MTGRSRGFGPAVAFLVACLAAVLLPASGASAAASEPLTVRLDSGQVRGSDDGGTRVFSGIRYAAPPVGQARWKMPRPVRPWSGVADATKPGKQCPQAQIPGMPLPTGEDCLFLNVTVPKSAPGERLPVMVWLHGGGYTSGAGHMYGAKRLAERGKVIVVTVNYRLGVFGYFGHPGLAGSGDFGLGDQLAALRWTKRNAAAFGGDAGNVTLFGQSAGAMSSCAILTSPASAGLFDKAILSSGSCLLDWPKSVMYPSAQPQTPYAPVSQTKMDGKAAAAKLGCAGKPDVLACLRKLPVSRLLPHMQEFSNHLSYNTPLLPLRPATALRAGVFHRVPVISGGNRDEMRSFIGGAVMQKPIDTQRYRSLLREAFGGNADRVAARYPLADYLSPAMAWATLTTDRSWSCETLRSDELMSRHTKVYGYEFADEHAPNVNQVETPDVPQGAAHANDLPSLFDLGGVRIPLSKPQQRLSAQLMDYWTSFAHNGNPNSPGTPKWQEFGAGKQIQRLAPGRDGVRPTDYSAYHQCGFWRSML